MTSTMTRLASCSDLRLKFFPEKKQDYMMLDYGYFNLYKLEAFVVRINEN